jgi:hypothetical protein
VTPPIAINFDSVAKSLDLIMASAGQLPTVSEVQRSEGIAIGVTSDYRSSVTYAASTLAAVVKTMHSEVEKVQEAVRLTVADMVARDATLADEGRAINTALDLIIASGANTPAPGRPADANIPRAW